MPRTGEPSCETAPSDGPDRPAIRFRHVDFPHPDGPTRLMNSPGSAAKVTSSNARTGSLAPPLATKAL
jgi:hypothetical protein